MTVAPWIPTAASAGEAGSFTSRALRARSTILAIGSSGKGPVKASGDLSSTRKD
jgi:hypothetical protein